MKRKHADETTCASAERMVRIFPAGAAGIATAAFGRSAHGAQASPLA